MIEININVSLGFGAKSYENTGNYFSWRLGKDISALLEEFLSVSVLILVV